MIALLTLIFVVALSMFVTKTATIALMRTGMARERAQFQAVSAFSGAGFTTSESEMVVKHPIRRRIVTTLILLGNAGVVTAISTLILGLVNPESGLVQTRGSWCSGSCATTTPTWASRGGAMSSRRATR